MKNKINTIASSLHKNHVKAVLYKKYGSNPQQLKRQIRTFGFSGMFLLCVFVQKKAINKILHKSFEAFPHMHVFVFQQQTYNFMVVGDSLNMYKQLKRKYTWSFDQPVPL